MRITGFLLFVVLLLACTSTASLSQECGETANVNSSKLSTTTKLALDFVKSIFGSVKGEEEIVKERDSIFVKFPDGQQGIIVYTMYRDECLMIKADPNMSTVQKIMLIERLQERLLKRVNGPRPLASTKTNQSLYHWKTQHIRYAILSPRKKPVLIAAQTDTRNPPNPSDFVEDEDEWIRQPPFLITNENKHFVIVESVNNETAGRVEIQTLKKRHPGYDFALYEPYGENTNYAIMMAAWVPYRIAQQALAVARKINSEAFIWSCRSIGGTC